MRTWNDKYQALVHPPIMLREGSHLDKILLWLFFVARILVSFTYQTMLICSCTKTWYLSKKSSATVFEASKFCQKTHNLRQKCICLVTKISEKITLLGIFLRPSVATNINSACTTLHKSACAPIMLSLGLGEGQHYLDASSLQHTWVAIPSSTFFFKILTSFP